MVATLPGAISCGILRFYEREVEGGWNILKDLVKVVYINPFTWIRATQQRQRLALKCRVAPYNNSFYPCSFFLPAVGSRGALRQRSQQHVLIATAVNLQVDVSFALQLFLYNLFVQIYSSRKEYSPFLISMVDCAPVATSTFALIQTPLDTITHPAVHPCGLEIISATPLLVRSRLSTTL